MPSIMLVLDGMQDVAYPTLGGKSPYDYGKGVNFARIERASAVGQLRTTPQGFEPDTQTCVLTLLGVEERDIPSGRSYIEALAVGMPVEDDDLVVRCNFVKIAPDGTMEVPCCMAPDDVAKALLEEVAARPGHRVRRVGSYKSLQCIAGGKKYLETFQGYPPHNYSGSPLEELLPGGNELAEDLAAFSRRMLAKYRPYTVYNWAQSAKGSLPQFRDLHGISGAMVSATDAPVGGAVAMGMACARPDTATGDTDTDLAAKVEATLRLAEQNDFVMLHVGGPDEATHRQDEREKAAFIAQMDAELIGPILDGAPVGTRIMVTCDHIALCSTSGHTAEPVDFWLYEKGSELAGNLGCRPGTEAVEILRGTV